MNATQNRDADRFKHRQIRKRTSDLKSPADPGHAQAARHPAGHINTGKSHNAGIRFDRPGNDVEQRGLAGAVGTDDAEDTALLDIKRHIVQRFESAKAFTDPLDLQKIAHQSRRAQSPTTPRGIRSTTTIRINP